MQASDIMSSLIYSVSPNDSVAHVRNKFVQHKISRLPVVEEGKIIGIITDRELSDAMYKLRDPIDAVPVSQIMRKDVAVVSPNDTPEAVAKAMDEKGFGEATVFDKQDNVILGMITKTDLIKYFTENYAGQATVTDIMQTDVKTIGKAHSIFRAAKEMEAHNIGRLIVIDGGPAGIITARDLALATFGLRPEKLTYISKRGSRKVHIKPMIVEDLMKPDLYTIPSKSDSVSAAKLMLNKSIGSVVAMDKGKMQGIITKSDIIAFLAKKT